MGTPIKKLSLPPDKIDAPITKFHVVKPIEGVLSGKVARYYDQPGGGTQFLLPKSVQYYLDNEYIEIYHDN